LIRNLNLPTKTMHLDSGFRRNDVNGIFEIASSEYVAGFVEITKKLTKNGRFFGSAPDREVRKGLILLWRLKQLCFPPKAYGRFI
jgi:hypothetical protein